MAAETAQEPRRAIGALAGVSEGRPKAEAPQTGAQAPTRRDEERKLREDLTRLLPGYKWTIDRGFTGQKWIEATGTISSGSNSTMRVTANPSSSFEYPWYSADVSGCGARSAIFASGGGRTLAQAVRALQDYCDEMARRYAGAAQHIADARVATTTESQA